MLATIITTAVSWFVTLVLGAIVAFMKSKYASLKKRNDEFEIRQQAVENGLQSLLRNDIIRSHDKYTERGYCRIYAKEALRREYNAYHALGGNGVITKLYDDIMALPEEQQPE